MIGRSGRGPAAEAAWRHVAERFSRFLAAIEPDRAETAAVETIGSEVAELLDRRFASSSRRLHPKPGAARKAIGTVQVIGGHAKATAISGSATLDLMHVTAEGSGPGGASEILELLAQRYGAIRIAAPGWLVVEPRNPMGENGRIKVRVLTALASASGGARVNVSTRRRPGAAWMHFNPAAEAAHLDVVDRLAEGKARDLIRIVKAWRRAVAAPLSGFAIELLATEFLSVWLYRRRSLLFYDWMVRDFFFWLTLQAGSTLTVPGTGEPLPLGNAWEQAAVAAHTAAVRAADLERDNQSLAALGHWREIFGLTMGDEPCRADDRKQHRLGRPGG
jgi:hypothetical protein